jgi:hypothetical protein
MALMLSVSLSVTAPQDDRRPVPDESARKQSLKLIQEVFKDDYAKPGAAERQALARKLLQQSGESKDDANARYALLMEARRLATDVGDAPTALGAVRDLASLYQVDGIALRQQCLSTLVPLAKSPEDLKTLALSLLELADEAAAQDNVQAAEKAALAAVPAAQRAKELSLVTRAQAKVKELGELKARFESVKKAFEKLKTSPDDAAANGTVGQYLCLAKGDWDAGLPHLRKGDDAALKALAEKEAQTSQDAAAQVSLADGWWDAGEKATGRTRDTARLRAAHWYRQSVDSLSGLSKVRVQKRLLDSGALRPPGNWLDVTDSNLFGYPGPKGESLEIVTPDKVGSGIDMVKFPPGQFDGVSAILRFKKGSEKPEGGFLIQKRQKGVLIIPESKKVQMLRLEATAYKRDDQAECPAKDYYVLTVLLYPKEYAVLIDGVEKFRVATEATRIDSLELQVSYATVEFDRIALRRKE